MQGSLSVSQSELHPMRIKFPYSLVCVLSLTRYIYAQKINERDLLHAHSSVGVSYLHADPQCIYSSRDSFCKDDRNNKVYLCRKDKRNRGKRIDFYHNVFNVIRLNLFIRGLRFLFSFYLCIIPFIYCLYLLFGYQGCHQGNVLLYSAPSSLPILFRCFLQLLCIICPPNVRGKSSFVGIFHVPY